MRTRLYAANGDVIFGRGNAAYTVNTPLAVGLAIQSRVNLWLGEWFIDLSDGTDWRGKVLGVRTEASREPLIRARILGTPNVIQISSFSANVNTTTRGYTFQAAVSTAYGITVVNSESGA